MNAELLAKIKREVGLVEPSPVIEKKASSDAIVSEINEYLANDTLSNFIGELEKSAGIQVSGEIKTFVASAEERGVSEDEIIDFIFEKQGYRIPKDSDSRHKDLLTKAANHISELTDRLEVMDQNLELVKVAMDMVQSDHVAPFTSFDDLMEKVSELVKEGDPILLKKAQEIARKRLPSIGKVATGKRGVAMSATDRYIQALMQINQGE